MEALAQQLGEALTQRGWRLVTAESCTGGWIAKAMTDIAGSSRWFERGFVTYSNEAKSELLGVDATLLAQAGAVSAETVAAMARGALAASHAQWAIAVSGVAGPGGGSESKPVGTVWIGWASEEQLVDTRCFHFAGERDAIRRQSVLAALAGSLERLDPPKG